MSKSDSSQCVGTASVPSWVFTVREQTGGDITGSQGQGRGARVRVSATAAPSALPALSPRQRWRAVHRLCRIEARARGGALGRVVGTGQAVVVHKSRAVGVGDDPEVLRARLHDEWLSGDKERRAAAGLAARAVSLLASAMLADQRAKEGPRAGRALARWQAADFRVRATKLQRAAFRLTAEAPLAALRRARVAATLAGDHKLGQWLLNMAGGRGWGLGRKFISLYRGTGCAARAGRWAMRQSALGRRPGVDVSQTSLEDAAAAAVAAMAEVLTDQHEHYMDGRTLYRVGWQAARKALSERVTPKGRNRPGPDASVPFDVATHEVEMPEFSAWLSEQGEHLCTRCAHSHYAGVLAGRWIARALGVARRGIAGATARQRHALIMALIAGKSWVDASSEAGYASPESACKSFEGVWARLADMVPPGPVERLARRHVRRARGEYKKQALSVRKLMGAAMAAGTVCNIPSSRRVLVNGAPKRGETLKQFMARHPAQSTLKEAGKWRTVRTVRPVRVVPPYVEALSRALNRKAQAAATLRRLSARYRALVEARRAGMLTACKGLRSKRNLGTAD